MRVNAYVAVCMVFGPVIVTVVGSEPLENPPVPLESSAAWHVAAERFQVSVTGFVPDKDMQPYSMPGVTPPYGSSSAVANKYVLFWKNTAKSGPFPRLN